MSYLIVADLKPVPAPRPRVTRYGTYNNPKYTNYKKALKVIASSIIKEPLQDAIKMRLLFQFAMPKSWSKKKKAGAFWHTQKPDTDNLIKSVKDALNSVAYADDAQVCEISAIKIWGKVDKIVIELEEIDSKEERVSNA